MKPLRLIAGLVSAGLIATAVPADAAWNNVFQVTCWSCQPKSSASLYYAPAPIVAYSAPAAGCCNPCQQCTTKYVQRSYYQPVTTYQTQSYYEAVTTYTTRTYYEPVTSYRYSCYYDPCSCGYQQVATPVTSYIARQQCCPVQSWVQRCAQVPVTSYQQSYYWEPQTCCTQTPCCTPTSGGPAGQPVPVVVTPPAVGAPPPADNRQTQPPPQVDGKSGTEGPYGNGQQQSQFRQLSPSGQTQVPVNPAPTPPPPTVKLERIAQNSGTSLSGQVVGDNNAPRAGAQLIFVSANRQSPEKSVTANASGRFDVQLAPGAWLIYVRTADGQQAYHSRTEVGSSQKTPIVLVSR